MVIYFTTKDGSTKKVSGVVSANINSKILIKEKSDALGVTELVVRTLFPTCAREVEFTAG